MIRHNRTSRLDMVTSTTGHITFDSINVCEAGCVTGGSSIRFKECGEKDLSVAIKPNSMWENAKGQEAVGGVMCLVR